LTRDTYIFLAFTLLFIGVNIYFLADGTLRLDWTGFGIIVAAGLTLALYSFLYKDNPLFKFAEHIFVGVAAAYVFGQYWYPTIYGEIVAKFAALASEEAETQGSTWWTRPYARYWRRRVSTPSSRPWLASVTGTVIATASPTSTLWPVSAPSATK